MMEYRYAIFGPVHNSGEHVVRRRSINEEPHGAIEAALQRTYEKIVGEREGKVEVTFKDGSGFRLNLEG